MQMDQDDYDAPVASSSSAATQPYAQRLLASILPPDAPADEHYESRLKDKKVQLSNPDRRRPRTSDGDDGEGKGHAAVKLAKRQKRASRVLRRPKAARDKEEAAAAASLAPPPSRRRQAHRGIANLDSATSYTALLPLHHFWTSYIQQFLNLVRLDAATQKWLPNPALIASQPRPQWRLTDSAIAHAQQQICKADLVGGLLRVTRASNPALVGIEGILAKETEHTVELASKGDATITPKSKKASRIFKVVPKHNAVFVVRVPLPAIGAANDKPTAFLEMPLQGNQMEGQMVTRATRKWKQKRTMDF